MLHRTFASDFPHEIAMEAALHEMKKSLYAKISTITTMPFSEKTPSDSTTSNVRFSPCCRWQTDPGDNARREGAKNRTAPVPRTTRYSDATEDASRVIKKALSGDQMILLQRKADLRLTSLVLAFASRVRVVSRPAMNPT
jgi:hypothetical protein